MGLSLQPTSRSRAAVARRAHNPKVGSSILPFATSGCFLLKQPFLFYLCCRAHIRQQADGSSNHLSQLLKKTSKRSFFIYWGETDNYPEISKRKVRKKQPV